MQTVLLEKDLNKYSSQENIEVANRHERMLNIINHQGNEIKTTLR